MTVTARAGTGSFVVALLYKVTVLGVVLHELAHQFVAELFDLEVTEVDYTSHVQHEAPRTLVQAVLVSGAPLAVNTAFAAAALFLAVGSTPFELAALSATPYDAIMVFVAFSLLFRAMPSVQDISNVFGGARRRLSWRRPHVLVAVLLLLPVVVPLYVGLRVAKATGTRVLVDLGYAAAALVLLFGVRVPLGWLPNLGLL